MLEYTLYVGDLVEVNSGGQVLFCFYSPAEAALGHHQKVTQSVDLGNLQSRDMLLPLQDSENPPLITRM